MISHSICVHILRKWMLHLINLSFIISFECHSWKSTKMCWKINSIYSKYSRNPTLKPLNRKVLQSVNFVSWMSASAVGLSQCYYARLSSVLSLNLTQTPLHAAQYKPLKCIIWIVVRLPNCQWRSSCWFKVVIKSKHDFRIEIHFCVLIYLDEAEVNGWLFQLRMCLWHRMRWNSIRTFSKPKITNALVLNLHN